MMISKHKVVYKTFKGFGIIYFVTRWEILVSINSKSINQSKQKFVIWSDFFCWKFEYLERLC